MSRFIIHNKVYDTDKMEHIGTVKKSYEVDVWWGDPIIKRYLCEVFRSEKGNYLLVSKRDLNDLWGEAITEAEAKKLLMHHDYENYAKFFGELEEA